MPALHSEHLMQVCADLAEPLVIANGPAGARRILYAKEGLFLGAKLRGSLLPGGGDWVLQRQDGVAQLDIRFVLRTHDEQLVYMSCAGMFDISQVLREQIQHGNAVEPTEYYFRTAIRFETGARQYEWLNRMLAVGVGQRTQAGMRTDIFAIK